MTAEIAIRVEGLGKKYVIGHQSAERYTALRDVLTQGATKLVRTARDLIHGRPVYAGDDFEEFWALRNVDFEVKHGEVLGIIGRNGAGKSTLLKILSRITEPTLGRVEIRGSVASLLEVGTGFHPELTGRENIYLNGAILGMNRKEIKGKFDNIVEFAGIEKFLDTPVKRYSSGMYVRLAFSVAAHLEPQILIVDEVLAVGDTEFQKRCLGKMKDVTKSGRTVLFVTHNLSIAEELCESCLLLDHGKVLAHTNTRNAISIYNGMGRADPKKALEYRNSNFWIKDFSLSSDGTRKSHFTKSETIRVGILIEFPGDDQTFHLGYALYGSDAKPLWWSFFGDRSGSTGLAPGLTRLETEIPPKTLNDGTYIIEILAARHGHSWIMPPDGRDLFMEFRVEGGAMGSTLLTGTTRPGHLFPIFPWDLKREE